MEETREREKAVPHDITRYAFEAVMAMTERQIKRLTVALVVAILGIVLSNMAWLYCWMHYDYVGDGVEQTVEMDGGDNGNTSFIGSRGMIINGQDQGYDTEMVDETDTENSDILK